MSNSRKAENAAQAQMTTPHHLASLDELLDSDDALEYNQESCVRAPVAALAPTNASELLESRRARRRAVAASSAGRYRHRKKERSTLRARSMCSMHLTFFSFSAGGG